MPSETSGPRVAPAAPNLSLTVFPSIMTTTGMLFAWWLPVRRIWRGTA